MKPINKLGYKINSKKPLGREIVLLIDNKALLDILEEAYSNLSNNETWTEKNDAVVITKELKKSAKTSGLYEILTCVHCKMSQDILMGEFKVTHEGDYIFWNINPPGAEIYFDDFKELEFKFHKPQYHAMLDKLIEAKMTPNNL